MRPYWQAMTDGSIVNAVEVKRTFLRKAMRVCVCVCVRFRHVLQPGSSRAHTELRAYVTSLSVALPGDARLAEASELLAHKVSFGTSAPCC